MTTELAERTRVAALTSRPTTDDDVATVTELRNRYGHEMLGRASQHREGHRFLGGVSRAATEHHLLCTGDLTGMRTDSRALLEAAVDLAVLTWADAAEHFDWTDLRMYVIHQVSKIHTEAIARALNIDHERVPQTFPTRGNIGPASVPFTLAMNSEHLMSGDRVACMGIGSGLNAAVIDIEW